MRRSRASRPIDIWPGFVDALASLLLVIIFLLMVFVLGQFVLNEAISGRDEQLGKLSKELTELGRVLALERGTNDDLRATVGRLQSELQTATTARDDLGRRLAQVQGQADDSAAAVEALRGDLAKANQAAGVSGKRAEELTAQLQELGAQLTALQRARDELEAELGRTRQTLTAEQTRAQEAAQAAATRQNADKAMLDKQAADLARALEALKIAGIRESDDKASIQQQIAEIGRLKGLSDTLEATRKKLEADIEAERAKLAEAGRALASQQDMTKAARADVDRVAADIASLRDQLTRVSRALEIADARNLDKDARITDLGTRLNAAMLNRVEELQRYRSEFFGKLRSAIGERSDVRVVGDRFVLPTEVLFTSGQAVLQPAGRDAIARIATSLKEISGTIPNDIPWVVRVDGHTDTVPIANERFPSNWELSVARAVSVVRFLIEQGIPANRLAAAGFGEFQPIDPDTSDAARARNRRIEFKLTER